MAEDKPTFIKRILLGVSAIKKLLSDHNTDKAAHPNGFNHNITITTGNEPVISLKQTSNAIGSGSTTMGTIGFTDKNDKWICFVDAECMTDHNALEIHINNVSSPAEYYNVPAVCSFNRNNDNTCSINLRNNRIDDVSVLNCTDRIVIKKDVEPTLWLMSTIQQNGTQNNGGGAILFKDKNGICLSALDTDTSATENQFNFHLASPTSTSTSTAIPSVMKLVHDVDDKKWLDLMNNSIKNAKVSTPTASDDKWSIVNKDYVDTALVPINSSLSSKSDKTHDHPQYLTGIPALDWSNLVRLDAVSVACTVADKIGNKPADITSNRKWTATKAGMCWCYPGQNGDLYINKIHIFDNRAYTQISFPVSAGDEIIYGYSGYDSFFVPFK